MIPPRLLTDGLRVAAANYPDKAAVVDEHSSLTFDRLLEGAERLAGHLQAAGLPRGGRVAIYLDNGGPCAVAVYGVLLAGGVIVVVNPQTKADKLRYILEDSGATGLITERKLAPHYEPATAGLGQLRLLISLGAVPDAASGLATAELGDVMRAAARLSRPAGSIPCDVAALIYTSGSTGAPKGVMQTHQSMVFAAWSILEYLRMSADDRILLVLPMAFDYGLYQLFMSVFVGATLTVERSFAFPGSVYRTLADGGITVLPGIPTIFSTMRAAHERSALVFPGVRIVTSTAAALPPHLIPSLREMFPGARIFKMYGLTECKRVSYLDPDLLDAHPDSVGVAIPGTEVSLRTPAGDLVTPGQPGILHVRGPHVMSGYWNRPDLTALMLRDGPVPGEKMLVTQDWFVQDEAGLLYFVARSDDIIKTRGEKVSPLEVENVLGRIEGVVEAAVVGVPDAVLGEAIRACLVLAPGSGLTEQEVRRFCSRHLENFMVPYEVRFLGHLPRTPNGKVDKRLLAGKGNADAGELLS